MHKEIRRLAAAGALILTLAAPAQAGAAIRTFVDGAELKTDVAPMVVGGRTLVPARAILEAIGAELAYDPATATVRATLGSRNVELRLGSRAAWVDGQFVLLDVPARAVEGRTMVPLRFIGEALGAQVLWNAEQQAVLVDTRRGVSRGQDRPLQPGDDGSTEPEVVPDALRTVVETALMQDGKPYRWGGMGPDAYDCSGFTIYVYAQAGIDLPRTSYDQFQVGTPVQKADLRPGDLVFFSTYRKGPSHVGIYLRDGLFISAASSRTDVAITSLSDSYWGSRYLGARRVLDN